jgi:hypothetical protein
MLSILTTLALAAAPQAVDPMGSLQRLAVPADPQGTVTISVELDGQPADLLLERYSIRAGDFQLLVAGANGSVTPVPAPRPNTWRGEVPGWPDTVVTATINDEGLSAIVADYATDREWQIQPASGLPSGTYSVIRTSDLPVTGGVCGVGNQVGFQSPSNGPATSNLGTGLQLCEVAFDADFEFYQRNGSSVSATIDDIERIMNRVDTIYVRDTDVTIQLTGIVVRTTSADPYTTNDAGQLLDQFRNHWNQNFSGIRRDLAHLFTGRNVNGGTIGIAYLGVVCSQTVGYGLSESRFTNNLASRTGLTAHEMGHNFNSNHCDGSGDCRIMCSGLGGCNNDVSRFGTASANGIRNYAISRGCLLDLSPPLALPVADEFPVTQLNRDLWISFQGTEITNAAVNEPSPPFSIRLNALSSTALKDDRLISNKLLLGGLNNASVSFYSQHRGVPAGGAIDVEILDANNDWILLERVVSDGVDESNFNFHQVAVPAGAYFDEAQVRITADVDSSSQNWYIDDFEITDNTCGGVSNYCFANPNSVTINGANISVLGSTSLAANDLTLLTASCPSLSFGIYILGDQQTQVFLGNGFLCVTGSPVYRLGIAQADIFGTSFLTIDNQNLPGGLTLSPGDTYNAQLWYRDSVGAGFNLSDGIQINFCP